jgi:predicted phosphohydrolase
MLIIKGGEFMALFAIGDLHLGMAVDKPMHVFGKYWDRHPQKIQFYWENQIDENDMILIPGDISWAMHLEEAIVDLRWLNNLPGKKILIKGNHDYWWKSITKMNELFRNIHFLQNSFLTYKEYAICGSRGWICPNDNRFDQQDLKIYKRELHRIRLSLDKAVKAGYSNFIVMTHYPPTNDKLEPSGFTEIYEHYGVKKVIYAHLHGKDSFKGGLQGEHNGIFYYLTSCDYLGFNPLKIMD